MTTINAVTVPTKEDGTLLKIDVSRMEIGGTDANFSWEVWSADENSEPKSMVLCGGLFIEGEEFAGWGSSDDYIINWVLNKLNFTKI